MNESKLVKICMVCNYIKKEEKWEKREEYEKENKNREYSHGICGKEECIRKYIGLTGLPSIIAEEIIRKNKEEETKVNKR